jgi:tellurite resistance protein TehA-like permease
MSMFFFRYPFLRMHPEDLTPPYWINMGAVAISTLSGCTLLEHSTLSPILMELRTFVMGLSLFFWAVGSWWIPMLVVLGVWRYIINNVAFRYDPLYWGGVFPLGMYCVCTYRLADALNAAFLMPLSAFFMFISVAAWAVTFAGMAESLLSRVARARPRD